MKTIWVQTDSAMRELYTLPEDVPNKFPTFDFIPNETKSAKEARWQDKYASLSMQQHAYIKARLVKAFLQAFQHNTFVSPRMVALMDIAIREFGDSMAADKAPFSMNWRTLIPFTHCIEINIDYTLNTKSHSIHACNVSPSEYERRVR